MGDRRKFRECYTRNEEMGSIGDCVCAQLIHFTYYHRMQPDKFEKDVDANHHIDFIFACSNIRCIQYGIEGR